MTIRTNKIKTKPIKININNKKRIIYKSIYQDYYYNSEEDNGDEMIDLRNCNNNLLMELIGFVQNSYNPFKLEEIENNSYIQTFDNDIYDDVIDDIQDLILDSYAIWCSLESIKYYIGCMFPQYNFLVSEAFEISEESESYEISEDNEFYEISEVNGPSLFARAIFNISEIDYNTYSQIIDCIKNEFPVSSVMYNEITNDSKELIISDIEELIINEFNLWLTNELIDDILKVIN